MTTPATGPEVMVTLCLLFEGMTSEGHPILRDRLNDKLFVLRPYAGEPKKARKTA